MLTISGTACVGPRERTGQPLDVFTCENTLLKGSLKAKPKRLDVGGSVSDDVEVAGSADEKNAQDVSLKTLDIFAGVLPPLLCNTLFKCYI